MFQTFFSWFATFNLQNLMRYIALAITQFLEKIYLKEVEKSLLSHNSATILQVQMLFSLNIFLQIFKNSKM